MPTQNWKKNDWNNFSSALILAIKDHIDQNISAPFLMTFETNANSSYLCLICDDAYRDNLESQAKALEQQNNKDASYLALNDARTNYDQTKALFQDFLTAFPADKVRTRSTNGTTRFEFYVTPYEMDELLKQKSTKYEAYRDQNSILMLCFPDVLIYKEGHILLSPAADLGHGLVYLRTAGCNTSALISTQLSQLLLTYLPERKTALTLTPLYGHRISPFAVAQFGIDDELIFMAMKSCLQPKTNKIFTAQNVDGRIELPQGPNNLYTLETMTPDAKIIYGKMLAIEASELSQPECRSVEVATPIFIDKLIDAMKESIEDQDDPAVVMKINAGIETLRHVKSKLPPAESPAPNVNHNKI